jgi:uncharacterized membrane-anchored protein YhcB (DUF1043 family)
MDLVHRRHISTHPGTLLKQNSVKDNFYSQNIARKFELNHWTFWEEFVPTQDYPRKTAGL